VGEGRYSSWGEFVRNTTITGYDRDMEEGALDARHSHFGSLERRPLSRSMVWGHGHRTGNHFITTVECSEMP